VWISLSFYAGLGEYQKAINDYDQVIALNPKDDGAFGNRGAGLFGACLKRNKQYRDYQKPYHFLGQGQ
jgi:tetratricopeptide (TPR) repeat protein